MNKMSIVKERFNNKRLAILGLGSENLAFLKFLAKNQVKAEITICDAANEESLKEKLADVKGMLLASLGRATNAAHTNLRGCLNLKFRTGKNYDARLTDFDIILRAPGYPLFSKNLIKAKKAGVEISSAMKMFFEFCPTKNIIGVTGSKGKGTTSSLIYEILKSALAKNNTPRPTGTPLSRGDLKKVWLGGKTGRFRSFGIIQLSIGRFGSKSAYRRYH
jgi:UDP-N-acetylmuramoylalanine--D-glutamate ligase